MSPVLSCALRVPEGLPRDYNEIPPDASNFAARRLFSLVKIGALVKFNPSIAHQISRSSALI